MKKISLKTKRETPELSMKEYYKEPVFPKVSLVLSDTVKVPEKGVIEFEYCLDETSHDHDENKKEYTLCLKSILEIEEKEIEEEEKPKKKSTEEAMDEHFSKSIEDED